MLTGKTNKDTLVGFGRYDVGSGAFCEEHPPTLFALLYAVAVLFHIAWPAVFLQTLKRAIKGTRHEHRRPTRNSHPPGRSSLLHLPNH